MTALADARRVPASATGAGRSVPRLVFANQLRGLAALSVVVSHLVGVYWAGREVVANATATPILQGEPSHLFRLVALPWFNFGPFGVAIFFLISGLVIPISLRDHSRWTFLLARLLRIYPTYMVGLAVSLAVVWANARAWHLPFPAGPRAILGNAFLVNSILGEPDITLVGWTLAIELKFYLVMMLVRPAVLSGSVSTLFAIAFAALAGNLAATSPAFAAWIDAAPQVETVIVWESSGLVFMLIGVLFNYRLRGLLPLGPFLLSAAGMTALFVAVWCTGAFSDQFPVITVDYLYAIALFGALYAVRDRLPRVRPLDALAAVSFPLYLVHSLLGYSALKALMLGAGLSYRLALPVTLVVVLGIATVLHISIERWTVTLGKRLSRAGRRTESVKAAFDARSYPPCPASGQKYAISGTPASTTMIESGRPSRG